MTQDTRQIINRLINMPPAELQEVTKAIDKITNDRIIKRRKELWGNVVAAIRKYETEIEDIEIDGISENGVPRVDTDNPGIIYIAY